MTPNDRISVIQHQSWAERCWQDQRANDEQIYEAELRRSGSPLVALLDRAELGKSPWKNPMMKN